MGTPESFANVYADDARARAYATLGYPGTYYLAFRDIPDLLARHVRGRRALDFGCGTGRSTRFLRAHGFDVVGVDAAKAMLEHARAADPGGDYRLVSDADVDLSGTGPFDLIFAAFTFDNVSPTETKVRLLTALSHRLAPGGRVVNLVSSPEIYTNEWASFSTKEFPENRDANSGDRVRIVMLDVHDRRPVEDVLFTDASYREAYAHAGLAVLEVLKPLGTRDETYAWVSETTVAPWTIWVLGSGA